MSSLRFTIAVAAGFMVMFLAHTALAQLPPASPGAGGAQQPIVDKEDGPAEEAPKTPGLLPTTPVLPPPHNKERQFELIELDGYFRFRGDRFKNLSQGFIDDPDLGGAPFPNPLACQLGQDLEPCANTLKSSNIRLRLEPTIHLDEKSSVHLQVDVLDNMVLGSTPDGYFTDGTPRPGFAPTSGLTDGQVDPVAGRNGANNSIVVKRAWAEVYTPLGLLKVGRMPWHWGLGIFANGGGDDPIHGGYDLDSDFGDSVDRLSFAAKIPGSRIRGEIAMDWTASAPSSAQTDLFGDRYRYQAWDLDDNDDVNQWVFAVSRMESPQEVQDLLDDGEMVINYGAFLAYRSQSWEQTEVNQGQEPDTTLFLRRNLGAYVPDFWGRLAVGDMNLELETLTILGSIENLSDLGASDSVNLRQFGAVGRFGYHFFDDDLLLQLEIGTASGDQWDNDPQGAIHVSNARLIPTSGDNSISSFRFDFDYEIDLILFRELIGTVTNATYTKPSVRYDISDKFTLQAQSILSFANVAVATPGNSSWLGLEFDADIGYANDGFFAGMSYGILFPFSGLDHPEDDASAGGPGFNYGAGNTGSANTSQTIQSRIVLKF